MRKFCADDIVYSAVRVLPGKTDREHPEYWLPLWMHLRDTAEIMELLLEKWLPRATVQTLCAELDERQQVKLGRFLGAVHDIGKATPAFLSVICPATDETLREEINRYFTLPTKQELTERSCTPHALAGEVLLLQAGCNDGISAIVGAHHGRPQGIQMDEEIQLGVYRRNYYGVHQEQTELWKQVHSALLSFALKQGGYQHIDELPLLTRQAQMLYAGLLVMADWIASNQSYCPLISTRSSGCDADYPVRAQSAWKSLALPTAWQSSSFSMYEERFEKRFGFMPNAVQKAVIEAVESTQKPGIFILEAQMGVGKTEAALAAAELLSAHLGCGGIFFGLPTQATANGIFPRMEHWGSAQSEQVQHSIRLAHAMAAMNENYQAIFHGTASSDDEQSGLLAHPWFEGGKQAMLAEFVVGTVDQLLMAALKQKHVMLRHLGLAGKVVIVDECHAYDAYMTQYLTTALRWCGSYGTPVIILSATLPCARRALLVDAYTNGNACSATDSWRNARNYPLLTWTDGTQVRQKEIPLTQDNKSVQITRMREENLPELLGEKMANGGCAGVIVNTVRRAQALAERLRATLPMHEILVFHACFLAPDRARLERLLLQRIGKASGAAQRNGLIVVGTQVLEQSLDIDFDLLVTELCPMDLLLQRMGRLHRHERQRPATLQTASCYVLGASEDTLDSGSTAIYGQWLLTRTKARLPQEIALPADIPTLVQEVYDEDLALLAQTEQTERARREYLFEKEQKQSRASAFCLPPPSKAKRASICGLLDTSVSGSEQDAQAAVRDGTSSVEVLVLQRRADGSVRFLPHQHGGTPLPADHVPSMEECRKIAGQRLRLPGIFSKQWNISKVITQLEQTGLQRMPEWQQSHWLRGELLLLLDEQMSTQLCGYRLWYDSNDGMKYEKEDDNEGNRVQPD